MNTRPELFRVALHVTDIDAAVAGYEHVLGLAADRVGPGRVYFDSGGAILVCVDPEVEGHDGPRGPNTGIVYIAVDDLELHYDRVRTSSFESLGRPRRRAWRERSFYARDAFGNPLCFVDAHTLYTGSDRKAMAKK